MGPVVGSFVRAGALSQPFLGRFTVVGHAPLNLCGCMLPLLFLLESLLQSWRQLPRSRLYV